MGNLASGRLLVCKSIFETKKGETLCRSTRHTSTLLESLKKMVTKLLCDQTT